MLVGKVPEQFWFRCIGDLGWSGSFRSLESSGSFDISRTPKFRYFGPSSCPFWSTTPLEVKRISPELNSDLILSKWSRTCRKFLRWKCSFKPQSLSHEWQHCEPKDLLSIKHYYWNIHFIIMDNFQFTKTGNCWISSKKQILNVPKVIYKPSQYLDGFKHHTVSINSFDWQCKRRMDCYVWM